jgi:16S rRNA (adenine1518-N6/adenine1519-N6)-dimethyltransferase
LIKARNKILGQNFLKDDRALDRIVSVLEVAPGEVVVEIGPGHGELTRRVLERNPQQLIAIEKDPQLIQYYLRQLADENNCLRLVEGDALLELPRLAEHELAGAPYKLLGNIPYYITGYLLRTLGELQNKPRTIVLTIQKEVAEKLCAQPPKMNLLAASVQVWGVAEIIRYISKKSFKPSPNVDSAVVKITTRAEAPDQSYYAFIRTLFSHPRKTAVNNLRPLGASREALENALISLRINPKARPQNLNIEEIQKLSSLLTPN